MFIFTGQAQLSMEVRPCSLTSDGQVVISLRLENSAVVPAFFIRMELREEDGK